MDRLKRAGQRVALLLGSLLLWELISKVGSWPHYLLPGPDEVLRSFGSMLVDGRLPTAVAKSVRRLLEGYLLSMVIGIPLGIGMARVGWLRFAFRPVVMGLQALPSICWLPLALLWFGLSDAAILFVVVMGSVLAIAIATEDGVHGIPPLMIQTAGTLGIRGARFNLGVLLPAAFPGIVTGLKLGWSFAWRALLAGELLFVSGGLGMLLTAGRDLLDVGQVMAVMLAIVIVGYAMDRLLFQALELRVRRRWGLLAPS